MKKKGFTLIELLVVIAIIAMLLAILMPALNKVKQLAQRLVCATNLKGLGTAMMVYSNDDKYDQYPNSNRGGQHVWGKNTGGWDNPTYDWSAPANAGTQMTIASNWYLLIREADVDPKSFVCKSSDQRPYEGQNPGGHELVELWDFGSTGYGKQIGEKLGARNCVSYAYQNVFSWSPTMPARPPSSSGPSSMGLAADKNPFQDVAAGAVNGSYDNETWVGNAAVIGNGDGEANGRLDIGLLEKYQIQLANSFAHNREGQNVLYGDGHTAFAKQSNVAVANDNIYTAFDTTGPIWTSFQKEVGGNMNGIPSGLPRTAQDTVLVNDDAFEMQD